MMAINNKNPFRRSTLLVSCLALSLTDASRGAMVINEILADPAAALFGDANGDGTRDSGDDEFVELVNDDVVSVDLSGWRLSDSVTVRYTFPNDTVVDPGAAVVVFGGGIPTGSFGGSLVFVASSLGLNNTGDTVILDNGTTEIDSFTYGSNGGDEQSLTRSPDLSGGFEKHGDIGESGGALYSPGTRIDGTAFVVSVPEPSSGALLLLSLAGALRRRR